jgi:excisionase family DNA binding protein
MQKALPLLTVDDIAERLRVSTRTVRRWIDDGTLPVLRLGRAVRIEERDLQFFLAERREG